MKRVVVVGASSGIGAATAKLLSEKGCITGITARRLEMLEELAAEMPGDTHIMKMDIADPEESVARLEKLAGDMGGMDTILINAAVARPPEGRIDWEDEKAQIDVNISGFVALAVYSFNYFIDAGGGTLAGVSSVAALRGNRFNPMYSASKSFMSRYLEGLRIRAKKEHKNVRVIEIRPGFIDAPINNMTENKAIVASPESAARDIYRALKSRNRVVYTPQIWKLVETPYRTIPDFIYEKF